MSSTGVNTGKGTTIRVGRGATPTWTKLAGIGDVNMPQAVADEIEVTHMDSDRKEFISGMTDSGEVAVELHWVPGSATDVLLKACQASGETVQIEFSVPAPTTLDPAAREIEVYAGFVKAYNRTAPVNDKMMAEVTFRLSGLVE
jgi:hypothetical protein